MEPSKIDIEISEIHKQNVKSVVKKLLTGIYVILMVGVISYSLLFLVIIIM